MLPGPQKHLAQLEAPAYRDSPVLPVDVVLEFEALDLDRSAGRARPVALFREFCGGLPVAAAQERQI